MLIIIDVWIVIVDTYYPLVKMIFVDVDGDDYDK